MRILHISDLHVVATVGEEVYGVDSFSSLERVLIQGTTEAPDLIIATGDLTERGDAASYRRVREVLTATGIPVFSVPGNHDSPERMEVALKGDGVQFGGVYDRAGWRLIFLNSAVPGQSHGCLAPSERERLRRALTDAPEAHCLVALHHSPISPCPSFGCQLEGASEFLRSLSEHSNARAVIGGHSHIAADSRYFGIQVVTTPSTCAGAIHFPATSCSDLVDFAASHRFDGSRHGYRIIDLEEDGTFASRVRWIRNPAAGTRRASESHSTSAEIS